MKGWRPYWEILAITALGAVLRFWGWWDFPLNHDEYSALARTGYDTFGALIREGVMTDTQPAATQVLLHYWVGWTNDRPWAVKLPFVLASIAAIPLCYAFLKRWTSVFAALVTSLLMAVLFVPVYFSVMARPYALGLFTFMLACYVWTLLVQEDRFRWRRAVELGVILALNAYIHHFAALSAALVWLCGWFLVRERRQRTAYGVAGLVAVLCYLPHLFILLAQVRQGGIGTIAALPGADFVPHMLWFYANYSWWMVGVIAAGWIVAWLVSGTHLRFTRFSVLLLVMWILPIAAGYAWSYGVDALLTERNVLFSFFFLPAFIFSLLPEQTFGRRVVVLGLIATVGVYSLVAERGFFRVQNTSVYPPLVATQLRSGSNTFGALSIMPHIAHRQAAHQGGRWTDPTWPLTDTSTLLGLRHALSRSDADTAIFGWSVQYYSPTLDMLPVILEYFPCLQASEGYVDGEIYTLSREQGTEDADTCYDARVHFYPPALLNATREFGEEDSSISLQVRPETEYPLEHRFRLVEAGFTKDDLLVASLALGIDSLVPDAHLVIEVRVDGERVHWQSRSAQEMIVPGSRGGRVYSVFRISELLDHWKEAEVMVHVWNREHTHFRIEGMSVSSLPGNPNLYRHIDPL